MDINSSLNIDTSSLTTSKLSEDEFKTIVLGNTQTILDKVFPDEFNKRKIKIKKEGLNFACPYCHDSATDPKKKRGNILLKGKFAGHFKCHNCFKYTTIQKFFKDFDTDLSLSEINYIHHEMINDETNYLKASSSLTSQVVNRVEAEKWAISREYIKKILGLLEISREGTPYAWNYLIGRCQYKNFERYLYSDKYKQILILNLIDKDKVLGIQLRNIDPTYNGPKYLTLTIDKMRQSMMGDHTPVPESVASLSCAFNIFNVDFAHTYSKPVLFTEGPFDAFLLPNCIAIAGANKNFQMNFPFWYVYDCDTTGNEHAINMLKRGYNVFLWKKFKRDYGIPDINPYIKNGNKLKWDVTDIMKYLRDIKSQKQLYWSPYFSNSMLEALNL